MTDFRTACILLALSFCGGLTGSAAADLVTRKSFTHPGILHSRAELDFVKAKVATGEEPWAAAWKELRSHRFSKLDWKQGVDLYGAYDNRLALGFEYAAKYNLGHDVPYKPYRSHEGRYHYKRISDKCRGRFSSIYERVYHHCHDRTGMEMPFTAQVVKKRRPERWDIAHASWATLMYAGQPGK